MKITFFYFLENSHRREGFRWLQTWMRYTTLSYAFKVCKSVHHHSVHKINKLDATTSQVYYLRFMYSSTCFGSPHAHHQELNNSSSSFRFYRWSVLVAVVLVVVGPAHFQLLHRKCINTSSGIITLKTSEWSKITKITRIHCTCNATTMYSRYFNNFTPLTCFQSDYTRCCINTIVLLKMSTVLLETCRGFKHIM